MAIIQISKIQQRSGNLVDLPQLDEAQFGWANDARRLFIGTTTPNPIENVEVLTSYSNISFSQVEGSGGSNVNITTPIQPGQILGYDVDTNSWVNTGGNTEDPGNTSYYAGLPVHLGTVANIKIGGGATGYVLETDGTGNLNWTSKGTLRTVINNLTLPIVTGSISTSTVTAGSFVVGRAYTINTVGTTNFTLIGASANTIGITFIATGVGTGDGDATLTTLTVTGVTSGALTLGMSISGTGVSANTYIAALGSGTGGNGTYYVNVSQTVVSGTINGSLVMTVANNTPYTNGLEITISGANASNANTIVNGQTFYVKVAGDFPTSGNTTLYTSQNLATANALVAANLGTYTANSGIATASLSGNSTSAAGGSVNTIQFNDGGILNGSSAFTLTSANGLTTVSLTGNFSASNIAGGNLVSANFFTGVLTTSAQPNITSTGTLASLSVSGNANIGNIGTAGLITATGNLNAGNIITGGIVSATGNGTFGNVTATTFTGALSGAATTAGTVTTNAQPNITSTGTLASLSVSGNANIGNIGTAGLITATGNLNAGNIITAGIMSSTGNLTSGNIITGGLITATGNITGANINGTFYGAGTGLTGIPGANVSGQVGNALVAGTVYTNDQPNITSTGTLASLSVSGNANIGNIGTAGIVSATGNITAPFFIGNGSQLTGITVAAGSTIVNGNSNVTVAANSDVSISVAGTSNVVIISNTGTNVSGTLSVSGNISGGNLILPNSATITTGANTNTGTITGNWSLSAGSQLNATYADLAEYYEADQQYESGTVLEFGGDKEVTIAEDGTNKVAGVVSTNPAYAMNANCQGIAVAIALQGRVPTKVRGTIRKGDMLVSGGDGYARPSSAPHMGTVIGKSLENFDGIEGIIEVAVGRL